MTKCSDAFVRTILLAGLFLGACGPRAVEAGVFDVREYGAKGDGITLDTVPIQRAIDAATAAGGGTVELPTGTYLSGTVWLKSNVDFHLAAGATLLGSTNRLDYNRRDAYPQNGGSVYECSDTGAHLVLCVEQRNVTVRGPGRIDGNGAKITLDANGMRYPRNARTYTGLDWRPSQMLCFVESEDVRVTDVALENSTYWTCFVHGCSRVQIRGVRIKNHPYVWNGDGIDLDCSQHVTISDCLIDSADDGITLRGVGSRLKRPQDMAYVTVANCVIRTRMCNAIRIGVGDRDIHDAVFSNLVIEDSRTGVMIGNGYSNPKNRVTVNGTGVWNMGFSNIQVVHARELALVLAQYSGGATTHDIVFSNVRATVDQASRIRGNAAFPFSNITFRDVFEPKGVEAVNVNGLSIDGGTFRSLPLTDEERQRISDDVTNYRNIIW